MFRDTVNAQKMPAFRKPTRKAPPPPCRPMSPTNEHQQLNYRLPPSLDTATPAWQSSTLPRNNGTLRNLEISPPMPQTGVPPVPGADLNSGWNNGGNHIGNQFHTLPGRRNVADIRNEMERNLAATTAPSTASVVRQPSLVRQPSIRPKKAPPAVPQRPQDDVLDQLYAERGTELSPAASEMGDGSLVAEVMSAYDARVARAHDHTPPPDDPGHSDDDQTNTASNRPGYVQRANSNASRPVKPPPPPPPKSVNDSSAALYVDDDNYYDVIPADEEGKPAIKKPKPPVKPPVAAKPKLIATDSMKRAELTDATNNASVKNLAARYDPKSGNVRANLWKK
jgi:hypothetical protein